MRKFIVSDLHGNGEVYKSIIGYLENISLTEEVELYINGDLIDRGIDSFTMLMDVYERINGKGHIKINYLGGNHELMMWQALKEREPGKNSRRWCKWLCNGGWIIEGEVNLRDDGEELYNELCKFLGKLKIYHKFEEKVQGKNILLVHAQVPKNIKDVCELKISDNNNVVEKAVWNRRESLGEKRVFLGKESYLTIIGHTPVSDSKGFEYDRIDNYFNIDGGCACYGNASFEYDKVPVVEVKDGYIKIIVFNHNNEIVNSYIFDGEIYHMTTKEINSERLFIDHKYDNCMEEQKTLIKRILEIS
jgi:hypothetical protein